MQAYIYDIAPASTNHWNNTLCCAVHFAGCDFKCQYCNVSNMLHFKEEYSRDLREIKEQIRENSCFSKKIMFTGAEPCIQQQQLLSLARFSKGLGLLIGIETNGSNPYCIRQLYNSNLLDFIQLDLKSPLDPEIFEKVTRSKTFFKTTAEIMESIQRSLEIIRRNKNKCEHLIKTVIVPGLMFQKEHIRRIAYLIKDLNWQIVAFTNKGALVNKRFTDISPPTEEFIKNIKEDFKGVCPYLI